MTEEQVKRITARLRALREAKRNYDDLLFDLAESFVVASIDRGRSVESSQAEKTAAQVNKRFASRKELAAIMGLSVRTISELQAAGLLAVRTGSSLQSDQRSLFHPHNLSARPLIAACNKSCLNPKKELENLRH
jgi:hypothetical protein